MLTQVSLFWFDLLKDVLPNHLITGDFDKMPTHIQKYRDQLEGRSILVKKMRVLPIEAIVRGYITGSGWAEYKKKGTICDIELPKGLVESQKLPTVLFTPSTKAEIGDHGKLFFLHNNCFINIFSGIYKFLFFTKYLVLYSER